MDFIVEPLKNPEPSETPREHVFEVTPAVAEIATTPDIIPVPAQTVSGIRTFLKRKVVWISALVLLVTFGAFILLTGGSFSEAKVTVAITAPPEITTGDLVHYSVEYRNDNESDINQVKLTFTYPTNALPVTDGVIGAERSEFINIGTLKANSSGKREFSAYIIGDSANVKTARATLMYIPTGLKSELRSEASQATTLQAAPIRINLVTPPTAVNGQSVAFYVDYRNESATDFTNLHIIVKYPSGFTVSKTTPAPAEQGQATTGISQQYTWILPLLKAGDTGRITIEGTLRGVERESKITSLIIQKSVPTSTGDIYIDFEKTDSSTTISTPFLSMYVRVNNSQDYVAHLGDRLYYTATIKNNSTMDITGLIARVTLDGTMYDLASVNSTGYFDSRTKTITWNSVATPALASLRPNQTVDVTFDVQLKPTFQGAVGSSVSLVKVSAHTETPNVPNDIDLAVLSADDEVITKISTAPTFSTQAFVNDTQFGSSGPFPPRVDQKTVFTIKMKIVNPSNDLKNIKISSVLPPGATWEVKTRASGSLPQSVFNKQTSVISWNLDAVPGGIGIAFPAYEAAFQVSITPSVNQVGNPVELLKNIRLNAVDSLTNEQIARAVNDITTSNPADAQSSGNVQP